MMSEGLLTQFDIITNEQAVDSEEGGDSDADDGFHFSNLRVCTGCQKKLKEPDTQHGPPSEASTPSTSESSTEEDDVEWIDELEEPAYHPSALLEVEVTYSDEASDKEDEDHTHTATAEPSSKRLRPAKKITEPSPFQWHSSNSQATNNIRGKFTASNYTQPFGPKVPVVLENFKKIFFVFFNLTIGNHIVEQSNLYATQKGHKLDLTLPELNAFIGILIIIGINQLPSMKMYWSADPAYQNTYVKSIMTLKRFLSILRFLHANDNTKMLPTTSPEFDKLFKIRPLITHFGKVFGDAFSPSRYLSIDESMVPFKGRTSSKQYMPLKPIRRGIKIWAICCAVTGYLIGFEVYSGKEQPTSNEPLGTRVVMGLTTSLQHLGYCIFFDHFFSSFSLIKELLKKGLFSCATILQTRKWFPTTLLKKDCALKTGESDYCFTDEFGLTKWRDRGKKSVCIVSSIDKPGGLTKILRRNEEGKKTEIDAPTSVFTYNSHMGGVDLFNQYVSYYSIQWKSRRWWLKIFYYFIDAAIVNSYILYKEEIKKRREEELNKIDDHLHTMDNDEEMDLNAAREKVKKNYKPVSHISYRLQLAKQVINQFSSITTPKRKFKITKRKFLAGQPSASVYVPREEFLHLPTRAAARRCAHCSTRKERKRSTYVCEKCDVGLCIDPCFKEFHLKMASSSNN